MLFSTPGTRPGRRSPHELRPHSGCYAAGDFSGEGALPDAPAGGVPAGTCTSGTCPPLQTPELQLDLRTGGGRTALLVARALTRDTWKISIIPEGSAAPGPSPMVLPVETRPVRLTVKPKKGGLLVVSGPELALEIRLDPFGFRFLDGGGRAVLSDNPADVDGLGRPAVPPLGFFDGPGGVRSVAASFHLRPGERLFGLGEKFTRLDKAGLRIVSWTVDALGSTSERSHKNVPFLWSSGGFGLFVATGARVTWDLGATSLQSWTFEAEAPAVEMYVFHGPRPEKILAAFTALTGRPPAVPDWSFGLWLSSGGTYRDQASIEALLDGLERHRLPADVIHIDPWWMRWRKYCDFEWDRTAFPDPEGLIRRIHALGLKLCLWEHPYISVESELFQHGEAQGLFRPEAGRRGLRHRLRAVARAAAGRPGPAGREGGDVERARGHRRPDEPRRPRLVQGPPPAGPPHGRRRLQDGFRRGHSRGRPLPRRTHRSRSCTISIPSSTTPRSSRSRRRRKAAASSGPARGRPAANGSRSAGRATRPRTGTAWPRRSEAGFRPACRAWRSGATTSAATAAAPDPELYVRWAQFGLFSSHSRMHGDSPREPWQFGDGGARHRQEIRRAEIPALPLYPERGARGARDRDARHPRPAARFPGRPERRGLGPRVHVRAVFPRRAGHP